MEGNSWRPAQGEGSVMESGTVDWRSQLQQEARQRIVNKIMETLKRHLPISVPEGLNELKKIAVRFEEKIYSAATSQSDYLRKISLKMLSMETKTQHTSQINPAMPNAGVVNHNSTDPASLGIPAQVGNPGQSLSIPNHQSTLTQNLQSNTSAAVQGSSSLPPSLPSVAGLGQSIMNSVTQASNLQNMTGVSQGSVNNSAGQGVSTDIYAQRQMQGRQHQQLMSQQQQQSQNPHIYQHQLQQQMLKQKLHSSLLQQQQQQSLMPPNQLQSSQQSLMQMSSALQSNQSTIQQTQESASQHGLQQNQIQQSVPSLLQQHPQEVARQQQTKPSILQQTSMQQHANSISQQSTLSSQQQQLMGQQGNMTSIQQAQLLGQQINIADMQQQQQRLPVQQTNLLSMQQQQQMMNQQNLSLQQQQLGSQSNMSGLLQQQQQQQQQQKQQQQLGSMPNVSNMQSHPRSMLLQNSAAQQQQTQQSSVTMMQSQGQHQSSQQQLMSQFQSQPAQLQQQLAMQQQSNSLQREMHQRLQASNTLLQTQSAIEQKPFAMEQKQFMQQQRTLPEVSSSTSIDSTAQTTHAGITDWQEECYQKIQSMKEMYLTELNDFHQKIALKLQQHEALMPPGKQTEQYEKLKNFKAMLERTLTLLQISKVNIPVGMKEKLPIYERQIMSMLASNRFKKVPPQPQGQQFQHPGGVPQQQPSQVTQMQQPDNHGNEGQQMNLQGPGTSMQSGGGSGMQHLSMSTPSHLGGSTAQQTISNVMQPGSNMDSVQSSSYNSLQPSAIASGQQGGMGSLQNSMSISQHSSINTLSQSAGNGAQTNTNPVQQSSNTLQQQQQQQQQHHMKQQQQLLQNQQMKQQIQHRHMQQQLLQQQQRHQLLQQQQPMQQQLQQQKQQQTSQLPGHQMQQLHSMNELNELKVRQGAGIKPGLYPQHYSSASQRHNYYHQQLKPGANFPVSSPQNLQASSPQLSHHSSPQMEHNILLSAVPKTEPSIQSANSPFIVRSPSTPFAPSPVPGDSEKQNSVIPSVLNAGLISHQQIPVPPSQTQVLVGTPGISASPLLVECTSQDGNQANLLAISKPNATERPLERLIKLVKSLPPKALSSSVGDIGSVINMVDRIAGSAPGNGSRAAVGEDLVAMTKCRLQAKNFISQDGGATTKKMTRQTNAMPLNNVSSAGSVNDSFKQLHGETSELESTSTSRVKRHKSEVNHALIEEIREINRHLIDTVVSVSGEDADSVAAASEGIEGTVVQCYFTAVTVSSELKAHFASSQMSPKMPLRLLVPTSYPKCSPVLLDKPPVEPSKEDEDLSVKAKTKFSIHLRSLSQPMSLGEMARTWDACARKVILEYAQQFGGGSFSSTYGSWEICLGA